MTSPHLRMARVDDAGPLADLYNPFITDTIITFELEPIAAATMADRIDAVLAAGLPWLVAESGTELLGYAYAAPWKPRQAYRFSVESSVYLAPTAQGRGLGRALYERLLAELKTLGVHSVLGGIALPNAASVALHEKLGFVQVGQLQEVGRKFDRWIDVGYWQCRLA